MASPLLTLQDIHLTFGGTPLLEGADLMLLERDRICLVGRNGSGKSTLLKIAAGLAEADQGERFIRPGITIQYLEQEPDLSAFESVNAYVNAGLAPGDDPYRASYFLEQLGLTGLEKPGALSGGEMRRAALVRVLAPEPDILLLDEPTNHLDLPAIEWLEQELSRLKSAVILISHDRRFLEVLSRKTVWIDRGKTRVLNKGFDQFEAWRDKIFEEEERDRHRLDRKIVREKHWVVHGITARRKRNQKRLANLQKLREKRQKLAENSRRAHETVTMRATEGRVSGKLVIEARGVSKAWGGVTVVRNFSLKVHRQDRIGIVGPNGAGKTTLIRMMTGELAPDSGDIKLGTKLELVTLDQKRESLAPTTMLKDALTDGSGDMVQLGDKQCHVVSYMKDFLFQPEQAGTPIEALSGGERGRLMLARAFTKPSNMLVFDEPTNDLDLETLDLLQELLADYKGTVILVSHDRDFLDRVVTSIIASNDDGSWISYAGGYSDMLFQRTSNDEGIGKSKHAGHKFAKKKGAQSAGKTDSHQLSSLPHARKLSYKDKHALETLPAKMDALVIEVATLQEKLEDPDLYNRDAQAFQKTADALKQAETDLAACEEEWLRLEMLREELENM